MDKVSEGVDVSVLILFFNRPEMLKRVFERVREARPSRLFLYQDGPRNASDVPQLEACRAIVSAVDWPCEVHTHYLDHNQGCDPSGYYAQQWAFSLTDKCIVLEDDLVPSLSFFHFCKELLDRYEHDERVGMISGFNPLGKVEGLSSDYLFSTAFSISGWASWRRVINQREEQYQFLDNRDAVAHLEALIRSRHYHKDFLKVCRGRRELGIPFFESLLQSTLYLHSQLSIYPCVNLIENIGTSSESTHFESSPEFLPRAYRRMLTQPAQELSFPLRHPQYIIEYVPFIRGVFRLQAWGHPLIKISRSFEELYLHLRKGNFRYILKSVRRRVQKWMGKRNYR